MSCSPFTGDRTGPSPRLPPGPYSEHPSGARDKDGALVTEFDYLVVGGGTAVMLTAERAAGLIRQVR